MQANGMVVAVTMDMHRVMRAMAILLFPKIRACTMEAILGTGTTSSSHNSSSKWDTAEEFESCLVLWGCLSLEVTQ